MNAISNNKILNTIQETIQDVRYMVEPVASDPTKPIPVSSIYNFFEAWSQSSSKIPSFDSWVKTTRPELH